MSSLYMFKKHQLSAAEQLWLAEAARPDFSPRRALERLRGKLPDHFRPNLIDSRLYDGSRIMPIGLWHVDPSHPNLQLLDKVIRAIRDQMPTEDIEVRFTAAQVAKLTGAEEPTVARAFQQLMDFGAGFFNTGRELPNGAGLDAIEFSKGNLFDYYRQYNGIEDLLERAYTRRGKDLYAPESYAYGSAPARHPADIGARVMQLLQLYEADTASTAELKNASHEHLVAAFNQFIFHHSARLGINGWADNIQSLRDGGVDAVWQFAIADRRRKFGIQVKSWGDLEHSVDTFRRTVMAQIAESRQMDLSMLFLALSADLTSRSQAEKARGIIADVQRMQDGYVHAISPEKVSGLWQWSRRIDLKALDQAREAGYALLTVIYDSLGNRNQNSWAKGNGGDWSDPKATTIRAGDVVDISAAAVSPGDEAPEYHFAVQRSGRVFETRQDWAPTSDWVWHLSAGDIGKGVFVKVATRRPKNYYQFGDADDYVTLSYDVLPPAS